MWKKQSNSIEDGPSILLFFIVLPSINGVLRNALPLGRFHFTQSNLYFFLFPEGVLHEAKWKWV